MKRKVRTVLFALLFACSGCFFLALLVPEEDDAEDQVSPAEATAVSVIVETLTATFVPSPSPTPSSTPSLTPEPSSTPDLLTTRLGEIEGVEAIRSTYLHGSVASFEIDVLPGYNTVDMAWELYRVAVMLASDATIDFSTILWDGEGPAIDYMLDKDIDDFQQTVLSVTPEATEIPMLEQSVQLVYGAMDANLRPCPDLSSECEPVDLLTYGERVTSTGTVSGESIQGNAVWYQLDHNEQIVYAHSSVISKTNPVLASPVVQPVATQVPVAQPSTGCGGATRCSEMASCAQAYACLNAGISQLDRDNDGVPCEAICPGG